LLDERKIEETREETTLYDKVMVAALEARRLNRRRFLSGMEGDAKVTTEALRRADGGDVGWTRDPQPEPAPEAEPAGESATDEEHSFAD